MRNQAGVRSTALTRTAAILAAALCAAACAVEVKVDFSKEVGPVKPMHAVGQPPILGQRDFQLFRLLKEAGVPYARLHDLGIWARLVDIPHVFPNFDADETRTNEIVPLPATLPPHSFLVMIVD